MLGPGELNRRIELGATDSVNGIAIVPPLSETGDDQIRDASVDFRLGRWFLALQQSRTSVIDLSEARSAEELEAREGRHYYVPFGERFIVHPGRFVLATTLEWIRVPPTIGGLITGKSSLGRRGLVIETAAGLHPGFSGCITLELANCGEVPIALVPGMKICQIFFHELDGPEDGSQTKFGGRRRPTFGSYSIDRFVDMAARVHRGQDQQSALSF